MRKTLQDQERLFGVDEALEDIRTRRPALADIATALSLLVKARLEVQATLPQASLLGQTPDLAGLAEGRPLLAPLLESLGAPSAELLARFRTAARSVLPAAAQAFPYMAADLARLAVRLDGQMDATPPEDRGDTLAARLLAALAPGLPAGAAAQAMAETADRLELAAPAVHLAATEVLMAVLAHESALLGPLVDQEAWRRGYCPVCGGGPDAGILKEGKEDSEFLIAKAGQLWLHCGQCAALWRFPRLRCVGCGCEDPARSDLLVAEENLRSEQERAHLCQDCKTYFLSVNLVDRTERINLEMLAAGLLHLDVLAQERGYAPVAPSPWNTLD